MASVLPPLPGVTHSGVHSLAEVHSLVEVVCHHGILVPSVQSCCIWSNGNPMQGSLFCQLDAVVCNWGSPWGCRWCVTITTVAGAGCLGLVMVDCIHGFGAVGDLFLDMLNGIQLTRRCLEWFCHKFAKELSLMAVCTDDMAMQLMLSVLIIDHLEAVHQCLDVCNEIFGVLSWPGYNILEFSEVHMGVDVMCHSLLYSVEEGRSFCLGCSPFLFIACGHPLHMHLQEFGSQGCKDILEVVLTIRCDVVEE